eukprot:TRINITY_DN649_c0_g3_i1.p1 TRINITY_DN649_c0_g3~~TRINITY_DN649_c0_g3_i1.p1  ORF type:complete len:236 (-),score=51.55 TRINITY_DN649_c0_g3_i1:315-1022(-)
MQPTELKTMYNRLWRTEHLDFLHKEPSDFDVATPLVRIFWSENAGIGKTYCIEKTAELHCAKNDKLRIPINGPVDVGFIIDRLNTPHFEHAERVVHINVASSADIRINLVLFELLILRHLSTVTGKRYNVKTTDAFLIELPTNISIRSDDDSKSHSVEKRFYFCSKSGGMPSKFREEINSDKNILDIMKEKEDIIYDEVTRNVMVVKVKYVQYVLKWLRAYKSGILRAGMDDLDF